MGWDETVSKVAPYLVRIDTPDGGGTGFLCFYNEDKTWIAFATALHVVARADEWQQPIRIWCQANQNQKLLNASDRFVFADPATDSAVIFVPNDFGLPQDVIPLLPASNTLPIGASIGWLGFPGIARNTMCFFTGTVSAVESIHTRAYLIDGVAINGVSGGPVIYHSIPDDTRWIIGVLAAYRPNRQYGEALPGLSVAQDVSHFHNILQTVRNIDEAERKKKELAALQAAEQSVGTGTGS
jgi:hypothetical protein